MGGPRPHRRMIVSGVIEFSMLRIAYCSMGWGSAYRKTTVILGAEEQDAVGPGAFCHCDLNYYNYYLFVEDPVRLQCVAQDVCACGREDLNLN